MNCQITFLVLIALALCGCSKRVHPPVALSTTDRVVVATNRIHSFGLTVTGPEAIKIASAVAGSKQDRLPATAMFDWDVQFYAGTNLLTIIHLQDRVFILGETQYSDDTGVLRVFWQKLESREGAR